MRKTLLILIISSLFFVSCSKKVVKPVDNPGSLYVEGVAELNKKKYDTAIADFAKIRENFPFDPIAIVAELKQGDAYFEKKEYQMAANTYEDYVNSYPDDENAPYALHGLAESLEKQSPTLDRDQAITVKAVERFTFLKNRYPTSSYVKDAETHIKKLTEKLAAREFYVGEFYCKTGSYNASILRLEYFLQTYPGAADRDKAFYYLAEDYRELNRPDKAQEYLNRLRQDYPKSIYAKLPANGGKPVQILAAASTPIVVTAAPARASVTTANVVAPVSAAATPAPIPLEAAPSAPAGVPAPSATSVPGITSPSQETAATPAAPSYEETRKRQIDLRPPETAPPATDGKTGMDVKGPIVAESKKDDSEKQAILSASEAPKSTAEEASSKANPPVKDETKSEPAKAEGETKDGDKKEAPKAGEKKGGLGFFTEKKPVDVVADTMEAFEKGKTIVFTGNVLAKQEGSEPGQTLFLYSDKLTAYRTDESSDIQEAEAEGNVKVVKAERTATCKQAFFYNQKGEVVLKGDVVVFEGNDRLTGDTATYYLNEDRVFVQGDKDTKAHVTVTPKK